MKTFKEIADSPASAIQGLGETDAKLLFEAFSIKTVRDPANLKFFKWAQAIVTLADTEE